MLHIVEYGKEHAQKTGGVPLILGHGLFGSARNWGSIAKRLGQSRYVIIYDQRNHGQSPWFDLHGYQEMATDLVQIIESHGGRADVMGHSMGGKAAMMLALMRPDLVQRLLVADIAPVVYTHDQNENIAIMQSLTPQELGDRSLAKEVLQQKTQDPMLAAFFAQSIDFQEGRWRLNLDVLALSMPDILGFPAVSGQFGGPVLFLAGALSDYIKRDHRPEIKRLFPNAHFAKLNDAGHWLQADKPKEFIATMQGFFVIQ